LLETDGTQLPIEDAPLQHVLAHSVTPHIVDGTPFGDAVGIGVQCLDFGCRAEGYWSIVSVCLGSSSTHLSPSLSVALLDDVPVRIAPTQTRLIPIRLSSLERIPEDVKQLDVQLTCVSSTRDNAQLMLQSTFVLRTTLPLTHVPLWTQEKHVPIQASYFFAKSMPSVFSVKPPKEAFGNSQTILGQRDNSKCRGNEPILALRKSKA
jgi:hypothetical protein